MRGKRRQTVEHHGRWTIPGTVSQGEQTTTRVGRIHDKFRVDMLQEALHMRHALSSTAPLGWICSGQVHGYGWVECRQLAGGARQCHAQVGAPRGPLGVPRQGHRPPGRVPVGEPTTTPLNRIRLVHRPHGRNPIRPSARSRARRGAVEAAHPVWDSWTPDHPDPPDDPQAVADRQPIRAETFGRGLLLFLQPPSG